MKHPLTVLLPLILIAGCSSVNSGSQLGQCPQPRFTGKAPEPYYSMSNPLQAGESNITAGERFYQSGAKPVPCARCHGSKGDGMGPMSAMFDPPPRNFTCARTINGVPDGQLYWIIQNGSPGTSMPAFSQFDEQQTWQLVLYLRQLANGHVRAGE